MGIFNIINLIINKLFKNIKKKENGFLFCKLTEMTSQNQIQLDCEIWFYLTHLFCYITYKIQEINFEIISLTKKKKE